MGDLRPCDDSVSEATGCRSRECNPLLGQVFVGDGLLTSDSDEFVAEGLLMENLWPNEDDLSNLALQAIENLHIHDTTCSSVSNLPFSSSHTTEPNDFSKNAVLCSEILQSRPSNVAKAELSNIEAGYNSTNIANNPYETSAIPLHVCTEFISALKGTRAQQGKPLNRNLHVTWAADVYDPPATSSSHTVKGHRHRQPKPKKEHHKHKHAKAKPSNSSSGDKKRSHRSSRSFVDPRMARLQAVASRSLQVGFGHSKVQALDIAAAAARSRESKCGGSFHSESPWLLPLPAAEAS